MKAILLSVVLCACALGAKSQSAEQTIRAYLTGYEKKDWNMVASQFTEDFTFTSPAGDDHISLARYKEKCFITSEFVRKVTFPKITVEGNTAFAIYEIATTDNKQVRNVEYYTFRNGKIKSIECFFGTGTGYPGNPSGPVH
jgi:ketosteroid isomerase-like protein